MNSEQDPPVRAIARALDILTVLTGGPESLGEVALSTNLTKGTVHRILATLAYREFVLQDQESGLYMLGPGMLKVIDGATRGFGGLGLIARPTMRELQDLTGETVALHVRLGDRRICIDELPSRQPVRYISGVGETAPVNSGSAGKVLLAFMPDDSLEELLLHAQLEAVTDATVVDATALRQQLDDVRARGWAESRGERVEGAVATSAPILGPDGYAVAALSVLGPVARLEPELDSIRTPLLKAARVISDQFTSAPASPI